MADLGQETGFAKEEETTAAAISVNCITVPRAIGWHGVPGFRVLPARQAKADPLGEDHTQQMRRTGERMWPNSRSALR